MMESHAFMGKEVEKMSLVIMTDFKCLLCTWHVPSGSVRRKGKMVPLCPLKQTPSLVSWWSDLISETGVWAAQPLAFHFWQFPRAYVDNDFAIFRGHGTRSYITYRSLMLKKVYFSSPSLPPMVCRYVYLPRVFSLAVILSPWKVVSSIFMHFSVQTLYKLIRVWWYWRGISKFSYLNF